MVMPMSEAKTNTRKMSKKQLQKRIEELESNIDLHKFLDTMELPPLLRNQAK